MTSFTRLLAALALITGCASTTPVPHTAVSPAAKNLTACQHFASQGQYIKNDATPTLSDITYFSAWIQMDSQDSTGTLSRDFTALYQQISAVLKNIGNNPPTTGMIAAGNQVKADCKALGIDITTTAS